MSYYRSKSRNSKSVSRDESSDDSTQQVLQALYDRRPYFQELLKSLLNLGLPVLQTKPNQKLITLITQNTFNLKLLQRLVSIKLEGQPAKLTKTNLAIIIKNYIKDLNLKNYNNIFLEEILGLVNETSEIVVYRKRTEISCEKKFDFQLFLSKLRMDDVQIMQQYNFTSIDVGCYYQVKNIENLRDYGDIEIFQQVRQLRAAIQEIIKALSDIIDAYETKNIQRIEDSVINYIELKKNIMMPFTVRKQPNENDFEEATQSSAKSSKSNKSVTFSNQVINDNKQLNSNNSNQSSILKSNRYEQKRISILNITPIQEDAQQESLSSQKKQSDQRVKIKRGRKSKADQQIQPSLWNELQQNKFENIFYQQVENKEFIQSKKEPLIDYSSRSKRLLKQMKHLVCFEVFDSNRNYDSKILEIKYINPRAPFKKYSFIDYEIDSEQEEENEAEDVRSEIRSQDETPSSSLQEFIEIDYKNQDYQGNDQPFIKIQDDSNFECFTQYKAIILTNIIPQMESTKRSKLSSKIQSKSNLKNLIIQEFQIFNNFE